MNEDLMKMLDELEGPLAVLTGVKKKLMDQGWSSEAAENLVLTMLQGKPK